MSSYYLLNDDKTTTPCEFEEWLQQNISYGDKPRHVATDIINDNLVSTVWLGINHQFGHYEPQIFETMIFDKDSHAIQGYQERYSTWKEAELGHKRAVQWVKDGCKDE